MKKLAKLMAGAFIFYMAGFITIYFVATVCGAPWNIGEWNGPIRVVFGFIGAPLVGMLWGVMLDEVS